GRPLSTAGPAASPRSSSAMASSSFPPTAVDSVPGTRPMSSPGDPEGGEERHDLRVVGKAGGGRQPEGAAPLAPERPRRPRTPGGFRRHREVAGGAVEEGGELGAVPAGDHRDAVSRRSDLQPVDRSHYQDG